MDLKTIECIGYTGNMGNGYCGCYYFRLKLRIEKHEKAFPKDKFK
jgi:hypothetical protein